MSYTHQPDINKKLWATWYFVNALDVYSTIEGLKYSCIEEANPTLPSVPHRDRLILHKTLLLSTIFHPKGELWRDSDIAILNMVMGLAVINNTSIINKAKNNPYCPKR